MAGIRRGRSDALGVLSALVMLGAALDGRDAAALPAGFVDDTFASGLTRPVAMAFAPDGRLFVTEQDGTIRVVKDGALLATPFASLSVDASGERGLLGIALDPAFAVNHRLYVYHTVPGTPPHNRVTRLTADGDVAQAGSAVTILDLEGLTTATNHNGGALRFGTDGKLYVAVGENAERDNAQSISNRKGKVLRIDADGTIPDDNPMTFPGVVGSPTGENRAIWAIGFRNPFSLAVRPGTDQIFVNDVGQGSFEEVDALAKGANYGWPAAEGTATDPIFTDPVYAYGHTTGSPQGCAITGGTFYDPATAVFPPDYVGRYFFADYCGGWIYSLDPAAPGTASPFHGGIGFPVDLVTGADGALYYLARGSGKVGRISFQNQSAQAIVLSKELLTVAEGRTATVTVRLAEPPATTLRVSVTRLLSDASVTRRPTSIDFTAANWNKPKSVTVTAAEDSDRDDDAATLLLAAPGVPTARLVVTATDNDRVARSPSASIALPRNGDTVSGRNAEFFGNASGAAVKAQFMIDGVVRYTDWNTDGHYHIGGDHNRWDTTTLKNGVHVLTMRVVGATGKWGTHQIRVTVAN